MKMTIGKRILLTSATLLAVTAGLGAFAFNRFGALRNSANEIVVHSLPPLYAVGEIGTNSADNYARLLMLIHSPTLDEKKYWKSEMDKISATNAGHVKTIDEAIVAPNVREAFNEVDTARNA